MRLYSPGARLAYLKTHSSYYRDGFLWALSLKPGDLINNCTGANVIIKEIHPEYTSFRKHGYYDTSHGWYMYDILFVSHLGGHCSLMNCGVEPPKSREEIEADTLLYLKDIQTLQWYGGTLPESTQERITILEAGGHICDERGVSYPRNHNDL